MARYRVVDSAPGGVLERMAGLAARSVGTPIAVVTIVHEDHVRLVTTYGVDPTHAPVPRDDQVLASVTTSDGVEVIDDVGGDPRVGTSEFLQEHHVRFCATAPIVTFDGYRLGAVVVMDTEARVLTTDHTRVLADLAAVVMDQLELRRSSLDAVSMERQLRGTAESARDVAEVDRGEAERDRDEARRERDRAHADRGIAERDRDSIEEFATALQRTLLPPSLPHIDGLQAAAYFRPVSARQVGGDFYDLFGLGDDRWAFFIGDVLGHGVDAAVVTSLIRYTLRSAALHYPDPTSGLAELNSVLLREVAPRRFCTVLFGTIEPVDGGESFRVTLATGGHPPALLVDPDGGIEAVRPGEGMLVGALPDAVFDVCTVTLRRGQILLFYTDGLIEARLDDLRFDELALSEFVAEHSGRGLAALMDDIATLAPKLSQRDDIAVLALEVAG